MQLYQPTKNLFQQIQFVLESLSNEEYARSMPILFNASIGQHVRHIIELFLELNDGYITGNVNYDKRKRDYAIESDRFFAMEKLNDLLQELVKPNKDLLLSTEYEIENEILMVDQTNYYREVIYNIEHTVHHMALIKVGVSQITSIELPKEFGVAASTIKYNLQCAQ